VSRRLRVLELFCGLGGIAAALGDLAEVVAALDVDRVALGVYGANFPHPTRARTLDSMAPGELAAAGADLWALSPPCQPYTRRGLGRDLDDPRAAGLRAVVAALGTGRPPFLFLENVPAFATSRSRELVTGALAAAGYGWREGLLCPSELGWPNRRRRYYLLAARDGLPDPPGGPPPWGLEDPPPGRPLAAFLDPVPEPGLEVPEELARRYRHALDVVSADDPDAVTACFTSAYGRSPVRSGSYLATGPPPGTGDPPPLRRFSPAELLRLLGFPGSFRLPAGLPRANAWRLAGNSLSLPAVRAVLAAVPGLAPAAAAAERPARP